ncbi:MAG: hypothetical protein HKN04_07140 [Rhodothermaceae bacterium]|nr:hypothetical protein [Rhodothermaceae bacterium]
MSFPIIMHPEGGDVSVTLAVDLSFGAIWAYTYASHKPPPFRGTDEDGPPEPFPLGSPADLDFRVHAWDVAVVRVGDDSVTGTVTLTWTQQPHDANADTGEGAGTVLKQREYPIEIEGAAAIAKVEDDAEFELGQPEPPPPLADASDATGDEEGAP